MSKVDQDRGRKPVNHLPPETEYHIEGNTKYGFVNNVVYLWDGRIEEWFPYAKYNAEKRWKKIANKRN